MVEDVSNGRVRTDGMAGFCVLECRPEKRHLLEKTMDDSQGGWNCLRLCIFGNVRGAELGCRVRISLWYLCISTLGLDG